MWAHLMCTTSPYSGEQSAALTRMMLISHFSVIKMSYCILKFLHSSVGSDLSSWLLPSCGQPELWACCQNAVRVTHTDSFILLLFVIKGPLEGASCLEPFQETTWSSYNDDYGLPQASALFFVTRSAPRSAPAGSPHPSALQRSVAHLISFVWLVSFTQMELLALTSHL